MVTIIVIFFIFKYIYRERDIHKYIELNTQNLNLIFKIAICFTKIPKTPKYFRTFGTFSKIEKIQIFILYYV